MLQYAGSSVWCDVIPKLFCACAGRTVDDHANVFEPEVLSNVHRNFYFDDCLKSVPSEREAVKLASALRSLL